MNKNRRQFLKTSIAGAAGAAVMGSFGHPETARASSHEPAKHLNILVLGGTGFIGPHMVREALRRGHTVSLFNRGKSNNELFPDLTTYKGDRNNDLGALEGHKWDAVIDNSGYVPRHVADSARLLSSAADFYLYISSISVYASFGEENDEDSALGRIEDETIEEVNNETYGPLKALCEKRATEEFGADRLAVLRPTYICGPGDRTDRYTYWPVRTMRGGDMLWPGMPADPIQIIDVRDLANFTIDCLERKTTGIYNTVTPKGSFTMGDLLEDCQAVTMAEMNPIWVSEEFIADNELPISIWSPPNGELAAVSLVSGERAAAQGLICRRTRETARGTISWWNKLPTERQKLRAGPKPEQEAQALEKWKAQQD